MIIAKAERRQRNDLKNGKIKLDDAICARAEKDDERKEDYSFEKERRNIH